MAASPKFGTKFVASCHPAGTRSQNSLAATERFPSAHGVPSELICCDFWWRIWSIWDHTISYGCTLNIWNLHMCMCIYIQYIHIYHICICKCPYTRETTNQIKLCISPLYPHDITIFGKNGCHRQIWSSIIGVMGLIDADRGCHDCHITSLSVCVCHSLFEVNQKNTSSLVQDAVRSCISASFSPPAKNQRLSRNPSPRPRMNQQLWFHHSLDRELWAQCNDCNEEANFWSISKWLVDGDITTGWSIRVPIGSHWYHSFEAVTGRSPVKAGLEPWALHIPGWI